MSNITFLASSKPITLPDEIKEHNNRPSYASEKEAIFFSVHELDSSWIKEIEGLFSMPYLYEAAGLESPLFLTYLEKHMETGDVIEIYSVANQHALEKYLQRLRETPQPIHINTDSYTYQDVYGQYQLNPKKWVEELSHKNYITDRGVTTIVKY
ncbi:hypothetical protein [Planomicrobium okeanokoites]|uniref:hypothetical protein n=1 Tax=Planomicrobium okeanokoites TaxID=244 RepID=UPI002491D16F|nr:hypothetical protein [Planomicrobium okeanokoites]